MNCPSCGQALPEAATFCSRCGHQISMTGDAADPVQIEVHRKKSRTYLIEAILVTLCCCQVAGIVAIVYAALANGQAKAGNLSQAERYGTIARRWSIAGFAVGAVIYLTYFGVMLLGVIGSRMH
jgi:hypothetical protein